MCSWTLSIDTPERSRALIQSINSEVDGFLRSSFCSRSQFPSDLLLELDEMRFKSIESNEEVVAKERPLPPADRKSKGRVPSSR